MNSLPDDEPVNPFASPKSSPASEFLEDARDIPLSRYGTVRMGLQMIYYSIGIIAGVLVLTILIQIVMVYTSEGNYPAFNEVLGVSSVGCLVAVLGLIVGFCSTLRSPRSNERILAITSVACFFLSIIGALVSTILPSYTGAFVSLPVLLSACVLSNVSTITFCLLLKRIGQNISSYHLTTSAHSMLVWYGIFFAVCILITVSTVIFERFGAVGQSLFGIILFLGASIIALTVLFKYLAMLRVGIGELDPKRGIQPAITHSGY